MDEAKALEIVAALADGVDPASGEVFPADSPYQSPQVVRALFVLLRMLDSRNNATRKRRPDLPANAGKPWSADQDQELLRQFDGGKPIREIADMQQRTVAGIEARLEKLGRLSPQQRQPSPRRFYGNNSGSNRATAGGVESGRTGNAGSGR